MFMLKDDSGRMVLLRNWGKSRELRAFYALDGTSLEKVDEAVICKGDDVFLNDEYVGSQMDEAGFGDLAWMIENNSVHVNNAIVGGQWRLSVKDEDKYFIEGRKVPKDEYERLMSVKAGFAEYDNLVGYRWSGAQLRGDVMVEMQIALEMIGEGKRVNVKTLMKGKAIGESRPRLLPGDTVVVDLRGKDVVGVIMSLTTKVSVLKKDAKRGSYAYSKVRRDDSVQAFDDEMLGELDSTLADNFAHVVKQDSRIYKAKLEDRNVMLPMFPDPKFDRNPREVHDAPSCHCPICGWIMADFYQSEEFECSFCRIRGKVINQTDDEVTLLMYRMPGKNRFAIKEARCCANCGLFNFETGRQGKRSTGYCPYSNQCLQAYNECDYWFPRKPSSYSSNIKQHVTNLGYGVTDRRNTDRNDIRDTIYREEDHEAERKRAERAKVVYANAYEKFMSEMTKFGKKVSVSDGALDEKDVEAWKARLDDGC
jgi:hypothetical protein